MNLNTYISVDWDFEISVGTKVGQSNNVGVQSDVVAEVGSSKGEGYRWVYVDKVVSRNGKGVENLSSVSEMKWLMSWIIIWE